MADVRAVNVEEVDGKVPAVTVRDELAKREKKGRETGVIVRDFWEDQTESAS
jgi:hypothetical protein